MMSRTPAQIMGLNKGLLQPGFDGDVVLVAPDEEYTVNPDGFAAKATTRRMRACAWPEG